MPDEHTRRGSLGLRERFPPVTTTAWEAAIRADLKEADYEQRLLWRIEEDLTARPFYRQEDLADLEAQTASRPGQFPYVRGAGRPWTIEDTFEPPAGAIRADRWHDGGATTVQEVGWSLAEGVDRLAAMTAEGRALEEAAASLTFVFAVGSTYFLEIAKLRAARLAWAQAVAAFGSAEPAAARMRLLVRTERANKSLTDPATNLLRVTTEAMAAVIGGSDRVVVEPFGFDPQLALNVQRILEHEALLGLVADPAGGSYFVESLTDAVARGAWRELQRIEGTGGFAAVAGEIEEALARGRAARAQAVASRRRTLVGVNTYPNPEAHMAAAAPRGSEGAWRMAVPFEQIRARTARHAAAAGRTPFVLLLTRGDLRMRTARANFALNFFGCAAFDVRQADDPAGQPADLIVLCSSDAEYLAFAQDICPRVAAPVIVAGYPKDQIEVLRAAGVQGFVHAGSDIVQTLTGWQDRFGVK